MPSRQFGWMPDAHLCLKLLQKDSVMALPWQLHCGSCWRRFVCRQGLRGSRRRPAGCRDRRGRAVRRGGRRSGKAMASAAAEMAASLSRDRAWRMDSSYWRLCRQPLRTSRKRQRHQEACAYHGGCRAGRFWQSTLLGGSRIVGDEYFLAAVRSWANQVRLPPRQSPVRDCCCSQWRGFTPGNFGLAQMAVTSLNPLECVSQK